MAWPSAGQTQVMIVGNDEKVRWNDDGAIVNGPPGKDTVSVVDIGTDPEHPRIVANLPLMNSVFGPPTNLAITPDGRVALVANAMRWTEKDGAWTSSPDNQVYVLDLTATPPRQVGTVEVGQQPSGLSIRPQGDLALVTNRAGNSISVLAIDGTAVRVVGTVEMGESVAHVVFTPDGRRALAVKFPGHKVAVMRIEGQRVIYDKYDMPVGLWPYNIAVTPDGRLALTADNGNSGTSDGHVDTVSVIDLDLSPPRVIDRVVVGDAPEGLAISPTGEVAVAVLLKGSGGVAQKAWFTNAAGSIVVLKIDGKTVTRVAEVDVGRMPEGAVFSPDGRYLYIGNFLGRDISILKVDGTTVTNTGRTLQLPGGPASMRGVK